MFDRAVRADLVGVDPAELTDDALLDLARAAMREVAAAEAVRLRALAEFARRRPPTGVEGDRMGGSPVEGFEAIPWVSTFAHDEVAAALGISPVAASLQMRLAQQLVHRLPSTLKSLASGDIDLGRARVLVEATEVLPDRQVLELEGEVLPGAAEQTTGRLRLVARRAAMRLDPRSAELRHRDAMTDRRVARQSMPDGMGELYAYLSAEESTALWRRIDKTARAFARADDDRGIDALRADAMVALVLGRAEAQRVPAERYAPRDPVSEPHSLTQRESTPHLVPERKSGLDSVAQRESEPGSVPEPEPDDAEPVRAQPLVLRDPEPGDPGAGRTPIVRPRAEIQVMVPLSTLLGGDEPGELVDHGPIDAATVRELAYSSDATWRRLLTDPVSGAVLELGAHTYVPGRALDRFVRKRDRTCRFPGCPRNADRCDLDHTVPFPAGSTVPRNLAALCRHHHLLKHHAGWTCDQLDDGSLRWVSPTGRVHVVPSPQPVR
jgi:hypothetical protein